MTRKAKTPVRCFIWPCKADTEDQIVGFEPVAGRLGRIDRLPGESLAQMAHRATWSVEGGGDIVLLPRLRGE